MADYKDLELIVLFDGNKDKFETAGDDGKIPKDVYKGRLVLITGKTDKQENSKKKPQIYASDEAGNGQYIPIPYSYVVGLKAGDVSLAAPNKLIEFVGANGISVSVNDEQKIQIDGGGIKDQAIEEITPLLASKADLEDGKIRVGQLPDYILGQMLFGGTIEGGTTTQMMVTPTANLLDKIDGTDADINADGQLIITNTSYKTYESVYFISSIDFGNTNVLNIPDVRIGDWIISTGTNWRKVDNTDAIVKVAGVTPVNGDINASDLAQKLAATGDANELALKSEVDAKYAKPGTGIPKSDLAQEVKDSLDQAVTDVSVRIPNGDTDYLVSTKSSSGHFRTFDLDVKTETIDNAINNTSTKGLATVEDIAAYLKARLSVKIIS